MGWPEAIVYVVFIIVGIPCTAAFFMTAMGVQIRFGGERGPAGPPGPVGPMGAMGAPAPPCPCINQKAPIAGPR